MFDFGFSELMLIGAVALVVLGPDKLPVVAKTAGEWLGKAQRLVQQVKSDIEREAELSELKQIKDQAQSLANDFSNTLKGQTDSISQEMKALEADIEKSAADAKDSFQKIASDSKDAVAPKDGAVSKDAAIPKDTLNPADTPEYNSLVDFNTPLNGTPDPVEDFYGWYGKAVDINDDSEDEAEDKKDEIKSFDKRYKAGPSVEELAEQLEKLKTELGDRSPKFGGNNRRYTARARTNRVRIYR